MPAGFCGHTGLPDGCQVIQPQSAVTGLGLKLLTEISNRENASQPSKSIRIRKGLDVLVLGRNPDGREKLLKDFLNMVFFMVSTHATAKIALKTKDFSGSFTIEWE